MICESGRMKTIFYYNRDKDEFEVNSGILSVKPDPNKMDTTGIIIVNQHIFIPTGHVGGFDLIPFCFGIKKRGPPNVYDKKKEINKCELLITKNEVLFQLDHKDVEFHELAWFQCDSELLEEYNDDKFLDIKKLFLEDTYPGQVYLVSDKSKMRIEMSLPEDDTRIFGFLPSENERKNIGEIYLKLGTKRVEYDFRKGLIHSGGSFYTIIEKHIEPFCDVIDKGKVDGITCNITGEMFNPHIKSNLVICLYIDEKGMLRIEDVRYTERYQYSYITEREDKLVSCLITFTKEDYDVNPIISRAQSRKEIANVE